MQLGVNAFSMICLMGTETLFLTWFSGMTIGRAFFLVLRCLYSLFSSNSCFAFWFLHLCIWRVTTYNAPRILQLGVQMFHLLNMAWQGGAAACCKNNTSHGSTWTFAGTNKTWPNAIVSFQLHAAEVTSLGKGNDKAWQKSMESLGGWRGH